MEKTNGQAGEPIQLDTPPPVDAASAQAAAIKQVDEFVGGIVAVTVNGLLNSCGVVPGEIVLASICKNLGGMIGAMYMGQEVEVLKFRKQCKDAFVQTMKSMPIKDVPKAPTLDGASLAAMSVGRQN